MLSLFQSLFDYQFVALGALRVILSLFFIIEGYQRFPKKKTADSVENIPSWKKNAYKSFFSSTEFVLGMFLCIGLFTQAIAILLPFIAIKRGCDQYRHKPATERNLSFYILLGVVSLFFVFSGPGAYGIDYPL